MSFAKKTQKTCPFKLRADLIVSLHREEMTDHLPANKEALQEALDLSTDILRNIELNELPLSNIALKSSRLARLLNEFDSQKIMECESGGYPSTPNGIPQETWRLAVLAERVYQQKENKTEELTS